MRNKIIIAFALIFSLFLVGSGITVFNLVNTSGKLKYLIGMHEIEDIRQELFSSILRVSAYVFASPDTFASHLDEIILNANIMDKTIHRCTDCHHEQKVQIELHETQQQVDDFEQQLSYLITIVSDVDRRQAKQEEVYQRSTTILKRVQDMVNRAALSIELKTIEATNELNRVYFLVGATLLGTVIFAFLIAQYLTKSITGPIESLVGSTRKISGGQWGYQADYKTTGEFQELIDAFNQMSESLAIKREHEELHLQKIKDTQQQLIEAEKLTALGTMAGGIAHDFNNILCGMIGQLGLLSKQIPQHEEHLKTIHTIEKAGFRAADLVKQLLTFARQKPMEQQIVSINKCIDDVVHLIENTLDKRIELKLNLGEHLPAIVGDAAQIEQVIINLCVNARDAMPEGGEISLHTDVFKPDEVFCSRHQSAQQRQYIQLTVQDTGCGINKKILPRVFDPFFTTKEVNKGTGLGLAMVYGILKNHDGFCTIDSTPNQGTTIKVYFPSSDKQVAETSSLIHTTIPPNMRIMIVDDEPTVVEMLKDHLERLGCTIFTAGNGQIAVDMLRENKDEIDLIILDINMPVMSGKDAYPLFLQIKPDVKVLVSTGYIMNKDTEKLLNMGAQGIIQKPYKMEEINAKILKILS